MTDTLLRRLARFAVDLSHEDLPAGVVERVRLQHLSAAGGLFELRHTALAKALHKSVGVRGRAAKFSGGSASAKGALRLHSTLLSAWALDDTLFMAPTSAGGVSAAWSLAKGRTLDEVVVATAAANEVAGRLGASLLLGPDSADTMGQVHALAAATAAGKLSGLDADTLTHAMALAVTGPGRLDVGLRTGDGPAHGEAVADAVVHGFEAVASAKKGVTGAPDALEATGGVLERGAWIPLRAAFTGLGTAWLSETLCFKQIAAPLSWQSPLQAVREVLRRHVKAADKRLRTDQVDRIEIGLPAPSFLLATRGMARSAQTPWAVPWHLESAVGALVAEHALDGRLHDPDMWEKQQPHIHSVAERVQIHHDWQLTLDLVSHAVDVWAPLMAGLTRPELTDALSLARSEGMVVSNPGAAELLSIIRARPDQMLTRLRYASGKLSDVPLDEWQFRLGANARVYTTRGGAWPEVREIPESSPGWSWGQTRTGVFAKHAGEEGDASASAALAAATGDTPAEDWVRTLLG